jgi:hypothetical protein
MKKIDEKLSEVFDIDSIEPVSKFEIEPVDQILPESFNDMNVIESDTDYARKNIRGLIEKGNKAMDSLLNVAAESEHPRAYEVAANMLKSLADMNKDLLDLQKKKRDLQPRDTNSKINVEKAVFVGSTKELLKALKENG